MLRLFLVLWGGACWCSCSLAASSRPRTSSRKKKGSGSCTRDYALRSTESADRFLTSILNPITVEEFFLDHFQRKAASAQRPGMPGYYGPMVTFEDVEYAIENGYKGTHSNQRLVYGKDWKLAKRIFRDGDYWTGIYKGEGADLGVEEAMKAVHSGFTVIMNGVQSAIPNVFQSAWQLETALGWHVNVNLYISPPGGYQGFEAHLDWMDGFIFQITGQKRWKVYEPALVSYPRPDLVRKPSISFLESESTPSDLFLKAGDFGMQSKSVSLIASSVRLILLSAYIPRGIVHEAHTSREDVSGDPSDVYQQASMHLTFGIELAKESSVEMLLHHFISKIPHERWSQLSDSLQLLRPSTDGITFQSDSGLISFQCLTSKDVDDRSGQHIQSDDNEYDKNSFNCVEKDILHMLLAAMAGYISEKESTILNDSVTFNESGDPFSTSLLRKAVGVTSLTSGMATLDPRVLLPEGLQVFARAIKKLGTKNLLSFLMEKKMMTVTSNPTCDSDVSCGDATCNGNNVATVGGSASEEKGHATEKAVLETAETLLPPDTTPSYTTLGSDFSASYINPFLSKRFKDGMGRLSLRISISNASVWERLILDTNTGESQVYDNEALDLYLSKQSWRVLDNVLSEFIEHSLMSEVRENFNEPVEHQTSGRSFNESKVYCRAWKTMMDTMAVEKNVRKKSGLAALSSAGFQMNAN